LTAKKGRKEGATMATGLAVGAKRAPIRNGMPALSTEICGKLTIIGSNWRS
jgi:hypothetical protein